GGWGGGALGSARDRERSAYGAAARPGGHGSLLVWRCPAAARRRRQPAPGGARLRRAAVFAAIERLLPETGQGARRRVRIDGGRREPRSRGQRETVRGA